MENCEVRSGQLFVNGEYVPVSPLVARIVLGVRRTDGRISESTARRMLAIERKWALWKLEESISRARSA